MSDTTIREPLPFGRTGWPRRQQGNADALWAFHDQLRVSAKGELYSKHSEEWFQEQAERLRSGQTIDLVETGKASAARAVCESAGASIDLLARQVATASVWTASFFPEDREQLMAFLNGWIVPHGRLLAHLVDAAHTWQLRFVDELSMGYFRIWHLMHFPEHLKEGHLFITEEELKGQKVTREILEAGKTTREVEKLIWRQVIRARDRLAQGQPLLQELPRNMQGTFKVWWLLGLELLNEIERRKYDLWKEPISLSWRHRLQVRFQAQFGKATFKPR